MKIEATVPGVISVTAAKRFAAHPPGLTTLFFAEMWERLRHARDSGVVHGGSCGARGPGLRNERSDFAVWHLHDGRVPALRARRTHCGPVSRGIAGGPVRGNHHRLRTLFDGSAFASFFLCRSQPHRAGNGNKLAGHFSRFFTVSDPGTLVRLYGGIAAMLIAGAFVLAIVAPKIERMTAPKRTL